MKNGHGTPIQTKIIDKGADWHIFSTLRRARAVGGGGKKNAANSIYQTTFR